MNDERAELINMELIDRIIEEMKNEGQEYIDASNEDEYGAVKEAVNGLIQIVQKHNDPTKMLADDFIAAVDNNLDYLLEENARNQIAHPSLDVEANMQNSFYVGCLNFAKQFISESFTNLTNYLKTKSQTAVDSAQDNKNVNSILS